MYSTIILCFSVIIYISACCDLNAPKVEIDQGVVVGEYVKTYKGRKFSSFTGVPYAVPPVGELRYKEPVPAKPWSGVLTATNFEVQCVHTNYFTDGAVVSGTEDCLYLNIYTPQLSESEKRSLPVMIYFHAGGFMTGHGNRHLYGPFLLLDKDIVLVVFNYRLGSMGFLSTGDEVVPGNNGLKDQTLAIKWVKGNIEHFGGNPNNITLFGQSAGGASVHHHLISPLSKNLMSGAIAQSGACTLSWAFKPKELASTNSKKLAEYVNCPTSSSFEMVECLRTIDALKLASYEKLFKKWGTFPFFPFSPVIEPHHKTAFISESPIDILKAGKESDVPFMIGFTSSDAAIFTPVFGNDLEKLHDLYKNFEDLAPLLFNYEEAVDKKSLSEKLKNQYLHSKDITLASAKDELCDLFNDGIIFSGLHLAVELHLKHRKSPVYFYNFDYLGTVGHVDCAWKSRLDLGVLHEDDVSYLMSCTKLSHILEENSNIVELLTTLWTNFAATGNPTPEINSIVKSKWEPAQIGSLKYYNISNYGVEMNENKYLERIKIWENIRNVRRVYEVKEEL